MKRNYSNTYYLCYFHLLFSIKSFTTLPHLSLSKSVIKFLLKKQKQKKTIINFHKNSQFRYFSFCFTFKVFSLKINEEEISTYLYIYVGIMFSYEMNCQKIVLSDLTQDSFADLTDRAAC